MNNYFSQYYIYIYIYFVRIFLILLLFLSYLPIININLNTIRPNIVGIIIFYYSIFDKEDVVTKEYLLLLLMIEYLLVSPIQGIITVVIYFWSFYFLKKNKNFFLSKSFYSIVLYYSLYSFIIEFLYGLRFLNLKRLFLKDFIFTSLNNLMFYILLHSIFMTCKFFTQQTSIKVNYKK